MIQYMFTHDATVWKESLKTGIVIPLYKKKGDKDVEGNKEMYAFWQWLPEFWPER